MELEKLTVEEINRRLAEPPSADELLLVPDEKHLLYAEMRKSKNRAEWNTRHIIYINNIVSEHDKQLTPLRVIFNFIATLIGLIGGIIVIVKIIMGGIGNIK